MTETPNPEPVEDSEENLDWDSNELGSMADYADNTEPETED